MEFISNYINGKRIPAHGGNTFPNINPHDGQELCRVARSGHEDVIAAIAAAQRAQPGWAAMTSVVRGDLLRGVALAMMKRKEEIASVVALETGKAMAHALGETQAAIEMGLFVAGEGRRNYGRTTTASMKHRTVMTVRRPVGLAALIIASNTPIANVAWKAFPSMFCGNGSILKPSEDAPGTAALFADICHEAGIPAGVFNVVHGLGAEVGPSLVASPDIPLVSFTGSHITGAQIQKVAGERLAKVCLELGGKNAMVVCDDADLDNALTWAIASSFSNAGQRCAACSRLIVFDSIYETFRDRLVAKTKALSLGVTDRDDLGPVINQRQLNSMLAAVDQAVGGGAKLLIGGVRATDAAHAAGFYMCPTILEGVAPDDDIALKELFGPITVLFRVSNLEEAIDLANHSSFGLTSSIHTDSMHRAMRYAEAVEAGVVVVNGGTHGSEPHMGFGGVKQSGTGWKEAGIEALDVYSEIKYINLIHNPERA